MDLQGWTDRPLGPNVVPQTVPLELENEYEVDPSQFHVLQSGRDRRRRDEAFHGYAQAFPSNQIPFASQGQQLVQDSFAGNVSYPSHAYGGGPTTSLQSPTNPVFHGHGHEHVHGQGSTQLDVYSFGGQSNALASGSHHSARSSPAYGRFQQQMGPAQQQMYGVPMSVNTAESHSGDGFQSNAAAYGDMSYGGVYEGQAATKRMREMDDTGYDGDEYEGEGTWDDGASQERKPKPIGACARCKGLKVRCVFARDPDVCDRCLKGNHVCNIPGRKKRRPPPKREHLINQIKEQAAQISDLMNKLEEANRRASRRVSVSKAAGAGPDANADVTLTSESMHAAAAPAAGEVADWITNARQSIEALGMYVSMGGPGVTMDMLGEEDPEQDSADEYESACAQGDEQGSPRASDGRRTPPLGDGYAASPASADTPSDGGPGSSSSGARRAGLGSAKLATLPNEDAPLGLMANLALSMSTRRRVPRREATPAADEDGEVGLANDHYFRPSPAPERPLVDEQLQPAILRNGIVRPDEAEKLFSIYFDYMNLSVSLLDPALYTAQKTYWRSPFLFTVICAIAARHYCARPNLYPQAMKYARLAAGTALIGGQKSIEVVQAYILLSLYPMPARRWEDDRSYIYLGLAIRFATDLKLHFPVTASKGDNELRAREMLNRTRTWLNCFNLDRSTSMQYGQSPVLSNQDYVANHTDEWWNGSPHNLPGFDVHLCCYKAELMVLAAFRARIYSDPGHPTGLNKNIDLAQIASETDDRLVALHEGWKPILNNARTEDPQCLFRTGLLRLAFSYARLSVLSVGFQHSFGKASANSEVPFLWRCLRAAQDTVLSVVDGLDTPTQKIYIRHGPEAQSVFVTFASAFLIKLLQPKYSVYLSREQRVELRDLVQRVIDLFGSPEVAIDDRHGPKLYARFLRGLLSTPMASIDHPLSLKYDQSPRRSKTASSASSSPAHPGTSARQSLSPRSAISSSQSSPKPQTPPPALPATPVSLDVPAAISTSDQYMQNPVQHHMEASSFSAPVSPPLFFDSELIQSMQSVDVYPDVVLPGFNWMGIDHTSALATALY